MNEFSAFPNMWQRGTFPDNFERQEFPIFNSKNLCLVKKMFIQVSECNIKMSESATILILCMNYKSFLEYAIHCLKIETRMEIGRIIQVKPCTCCNTQTKIIPVIFFWITNGLADLIGTCICLPYGYWELLNFGFFWVAFLRF